MNDDPSGPSPPTASYVIAFAIVAVLAVGSEWIQHHPALALQAADAVGLDASTDGFRLVFDCIRFQGSDLFGAAGYVLWQPLLGTQRPLGHRVLSVFASLFCLELVQMAVRGAPLDHLDLIAYGLGVGLAAIIARCA